jgi:diguanylate cyclase (GGDEF)-like protein
LEYTVRGGFLRAQLLNEVAERDGLTSLNNRRYFDLSYRQLIKDCNLHGHSVAVAMFDVDHFKSHNDQHGHQFGDRVIQAVAEGLASGSETRPALLARYGGDEFVAVWTGHSSSDAIEAVQQMRDAVKKVAQRNLSIETKLKISAGLAWSYAPFEGEQMLKTADDALYKAKTEGRDRLVTIAD